MSYDGIDCLRSSPDTGDLISAIADTLYKNPHNDTIVFSIDSFAYF